MTSSHRSHGESSPEHPRHAHEHKAQSSKIEKDDLHQKVLEDHREATLKNRKIASSPSGHYSRRSRSRERKSEDEVTGEAKNDHRRRSRSRSHSPPSADEQGDGSPKSQTSFRRRTPRKIVKLTRVAKRSKALQDEETKVYSQADVGKEETVQPDPDLPPTTRVLEFIDKDGRPHFSYPDMKGIQGTDAVDLDELEDDGKAKQARLDFSIRGGANSHKTTNAERNSVSTGADKISSSNLETNEFTSSSAFIELINKFISSFARNQKPASDVAIPELRVVMELNIRFHAT